MRFTVLIPTYNNTRLIRCAIRSVLRQTERNIELLVVSDGAPKATHTIVKRFEAADRRVRLLSFDKGERHGEAWRHAALEQATGDVVCYLSDDDFWFPDHLEIMGRTLHTADFAHTRHTVVSQSGRISGHVGDLADPALRRTMIETRTNIFGLSFAGHRLDAYRKLPVGWSPAPEGLWTDLHMWRKWLSAPGMRFASCQVTTGLNLPAFHRPGVAFSDRLAEQHNWFEIFSEPHMVEALRLVMPEDDTPVTIAKVVVTARAMRQRETSPRRIAERAAKRLLRRIRAWRPASAPRLPA